MTTKRTEGGHSATDPRDSRAADEPERNGHNRRVPQSTDADLSDLHAFMGHYARQLWDYQKVRIMTGNRISAMERDGLASQHLAPMQATADELEKLESVISRKLENLAKRHFMADWIGSARGIGLGGFGRLMGITGPLLPATFDEEGKPTGGFATVSKLWKYLGMSVDGGEAPKMRKGEKLSYSPQGRVVCHQIADSIVKIGAGGPYREAYDRKKAEYLARERIGPAGCPMGHEHRSATKAILQCVKVDADGHETSGHLDSAAKRYAIKMLLRDMWVEWGRRSAEADLESSVGLPSVEATSAA